MFKLKRDHGHAHECPIVFNLSYTGVEETNKHGPGVYRTSKYLWDRNKLTKSSDLTGNVEDALMLESIQRVERLASCVQPLCIFKMSAKILTLNTVALGGLRELDHILVSKISEIKIDWKSKERRSSIKEKEDLLCNSSPCFKHLSRIAIFCLEGPK
ncbi:unnamed protein product [Brassica oleracea]|uniref:Uncharacterized protein n=1 Tax=Brassica oleracea TaxID=3712 RepID=A0A3P6GV70_BRAOL|nr:unnamed protein product [Brassica oleracea]